ncbi:MAG: glycosyltransferase family 2 protein [Candidatus Eisenbacteria sp.]|nr:glycosyltransferase family 2 protein [Candidatus Eisenbacteria bacterium]
MSEPAIAQPEVSVVVPLFNEVESLVELERGIRESLTTLGLSYEIIFVDDGSVDGSFDAVAKLHSERPGIRAIRFRRNYGKAAALAFGFEAARGNFIVTMDGDLQDDPGEIGKLLARMDEGYDLVSGWKRQRQDPWTKRWPSRCFNWVTSRVSGIRIHDFNCGLKAYRKAVTREIAVYGELHRYLPVLAHWRGFRVAEVEVRHRERKYGRTKYGLQRFIRGFLDLLTVVMITRYTRSPLHLFGTTGIVLNLVGIIINSYLLILKFQHGDIQGRTPLLMLGVLLMMVGVQFVSIGLLGEMIARIQQSDERDYSVLETLD